MSLREEIEELIRWELSSDPTVRRVVFEGGPDLTVLTPDEHVMLTFKVIGAYRVAWDGLRMR